MVFRRFTLVCLVLGATLFACTLCPAQTAAELNTEGVALYNAARFDEAIRVFESAYDQVPDNATVRRNLCNAHQATAHHLAKQADFAAAAKHLETAIGIDPENPSPLIQLGSYYLRLDMVPEAIARLEESIQLSPKNVTAHELLGDAYYMDNDMSSAKTQWEWVAQVEPGRTGVKEKLAKAAREENVETGFRPTESKHFQLSYDPDISARSVRQVRTILEKAYVQIGRNFGGVYPPAAVQVIIYKAGGFADATLAAEHVGALYDGKIRLPLVDSSGNLLPEQTLHERLFHEYTHVVVRFLTGDNVPWWLNEGLAESFSRDLSSDRLALLRAAIGDNLLLPLSALEAGQLDRLDSTALRLAYAQAHATVDYLWKRYGQRRIADMLSELTAGRSASEALANTYNRTYESLQKEVSRYIMSTGE